LRKIARPGVVALVAAAVVISVTAGAPALAHSNSTQQSPNRHRVSIDSFMTGLACIESSGRYEARNPVTGAYGKYQIMPRNWPYWAAYYMHNRWALPTPSNQEFVARARILDLYKLRGHWRLVAHWWLTGNADPNEGLWTSSSAHYVNAVMSFARDAATPQLHTLVPNRCAPLPSINPDIRTTPWPHVRINGKRVYLRSEPSTKALVIGLVKEGERYAALGFKKDERGEQWIQLGLADGSTGWVAAWLTNAPDTGLGSAARGSAN